MKKAEVETGLALVQQTLEQWLSFKRYLLKSYSEEPLQPQDETNFLDVKSAVARNVRSLGEQSKEMTALDYGSTVMRDLLTKCVSLTHLRALPAADKKTIYKDWHVVSVRLTRAVGALKFMSEGYVPPAPPKSKSKGKKKGKK